MNKELIVKKCDICGGIVKVLKDSKFICCGEEMRKLVPNSVEASFEKHIPTYEVVDGKLVVTVNHVMEEKHYIEWITVVTENGEVTKNFKPGEVPTLTLDYEKGAVIYAYCNLHELWKADVK